MAKRRRKYNRFAQVPGRSHSEPTPDAAPAHAALHHDEVSAHPTS